MYEQLHVPGWLGNCPNPLIGSTLHVFNSSIYTESRKTLPGGIHIPLNYTNCQQAPGCWCSACSMQAIPIRTYDYIIYVPRFDVVVLFAIQSSVTRADPQRRWCVVVRTFAANVIICISYNPLPSAYRTFLYEYMYVYARIDCRRQRYRGNFENGFWNIHQPTRDTAVTNPVVAFNTRARWLNKRQQDMCI